MYEQEGGRVKGWQLCNYIIHVHMQYVHYTSIYIHTNRFIIVHVCMSGSHGSFKLTYNTHYHMTLVPPSHLSFFEVVQFMVENSNVVKYLWRNIGTNGVCQDLTGLLVSLEGTLDRATHTCTCTCM